LQGEKLSKSILFLKIISTFTGGSMNQDVEPMKTAKAKEPKAPVSILAPVDLSAASRISGGYAIDVARAFDAEILFLHVIPEHSLSGRFFFPQGRAEGEEELGEEEARKALSRLDDFLEALPLHGVRHTKRIEKGVPYEKILEVVEDLRPTVVIQGTHGSTGLEGRVLGGTAERIIRKTNCPVISVKPMGFGSFLSKIVEGMGLFEKNRGEGHAPREAYTFPPRRILHPTDFSDASRMAVKPAIDLARMAEAELLVLHVSDANEDTYQPHATDPPSEKPPGTVDEQMEDLLTEMNAYYEGLQITPHVLRSGSPSSILAFAVKEDVDLIVMGTHGLTGWKLILTGSTADRAIRNAPCPVMTVRPNWKLEEAEKRFRKVFRKLTPMDLQKMSSEPAFHIPEDLLGPSDDMRKPELFLNTYSQEGMLEAFEEYGILGNLRRRGVDGVRIVFDFQDAFRHRMRVYAHEMEKDDPPLIDLIVREGILQLEHREGQREGKSEHHFSVLVIEWICLQNPSALFTPDRPPLPGQEFPGLGIGYEAHEFLVVVGMRLKKDGIMNRPQYAHNARLYHEKFKFVDPVKEGRLIALTRDTGDYNLADVSWAVYHECLKDAATGETVPWDGGKQVYPLSVKLRNHFLSDDYLNRVWETVANTRYVIDWNLFQKRMQSDPRRPTEES